MQNIRLTLQYDGTRYLGWQKPANGGKDKTLSRRISAVLEKITDETITLYAGARTEAGVHALAQTANFYTNAQIDPIQIREYLNRYLPQDIAVTDCAAAPERFRADLNARSRTYEYRICTAPVHDIFTASHTAHMYPAPDLELMREGASLLTGRHDFRPFSRVHKKKRTIKEILDLHFTVSDSQPDLLKISVTADDFLYQMPSLMIGTLLDIGTGKEDPRIIYRILEGKEKAETLCDTKGLLLKSIQY